MIKHPPKFDPNWPHAVKGSEHESLYWKLFSQVDSKGRYLHWDEYRHRFDAKLKPTIAWSVVKSARQPSRQFLYELPNSTDKRFLSINTIPSINRRCSFVDRWCSGPAFNAMINSMDALQYLIEDLDEEESIASSQLEGAATTRKVAKEMLQTKREPRSKDEKMILGNFKMMNFVWEMRNEDLNLNLIKQLHAIGTEDIDDEHYFPGEFRKSNDVVVTDYDDNILHQPPDTKELNFRLKLICNFANKKHQELDTNEYLHPMVKAIVLHFCIGYEHPFHDGNGRVARALYYWYLFKCGYKSFRYISISALLKQADTKYGKSYLYTESDDHDLTYFIDYQCQVIERAVNNFVSFVQRSITERHQFDQWMYESRLMSVLNTRQSLIVSMIASGRQTVFVVKELQERFSVSNNTTRNDLEQLADLGFLIRQRQGRSVIYRGEPGYSKIRKIWDKVKSD
ncbi:Fic family protein [Ferrimonas sp.]|uniref:Fic family protein n=1 Tax=Ferrimonas sp. TaxID=2080861 RepID=UPI003A8ECDCF